VEDGLAVEMEVVGEVVTEAAAVEVVEEMGEVAVAAVVAKRQEEQFGLRDVVF